MLSILEDIFGWWLGIVCEARFEDDFYWISDPPEPQKTHENLRDFTFSARSLRTSIWERFLLHFRTPDPIKIGPLRCPNAIRKKIQKNVAFGRLRGRFCMDFGTQLGSWGGVREGRFERFLRSWSCLGGKMAPGCPKSASKTDFGPIWVDFWSIFNVFLMLLPPFLLALKRELRIEFGLLCRSRN